jgi:hypothetical protein
MLLLAVSCASGPATYEWVNEIDPEAFWKRDYYECEQEAEQAEKLPAANIAGSVALAMNIAKRRGDCMAARGWKQVPITEGTTALTSPSAPSTPISVRSVPERAEVYIDGNFVGNTPLRDFRLAPGVHQIEVRHSGFATWRRELTVQAGTPVAVDANLERAP